MVCPIQLHWLCKRYPITLIISDQPRRKNPMITHHHQSTNYIALKKTYFQFFSPLGLSRLDPPQTTTQPLSINKNPSKCWLNPTISYPINTIKQPPSIVSFLTVKGSLKPFKGLLSHLQITRQPGLNYCKAFFLVDSSFLFLKPQRSRNNIKSCQLKRHKNPYNLWLSPMPFNSTSTVQHILTCLIFKGNVSWILGPETSVISFRQKSHRLAGVKSAKSSMPKPPTAALQESGSVMR